MNHVNIGKILVGLIFGLAILLGLFQRGQSLFGSNTSIVPFGGTSDGSLEDYYNKARELAKEQKQTTEVSFLAVGDIMLSRNVADATRKSGQANLPFSKLDNLFNSVNFAFGNLETPVAQNQGTFGGHSLIFNSPQDYVKELAAANFKIVNLANNHAMDQGLKGMQFTRKFLDDLKIQHIGTGNNLDEAWQPAIIEQNGIKLCFIGASYSSINDNGKTTNDYVARIENTERLKSEINKSKSACNFIVATMHAGTEYVRQPNQSQIDFAHQAIDLGADIVIGAHPHWVQTLEKYNEKYIFYSLGNFIFDQEFSQDTKEGLALKITVSQTSVSNKTISGAAMLDDLQGSKIKAQIQSIELLPVIIENYSTPRLADEKEAKKILQKIGQPETILK